MKHIYADISSLTENIPKKDIADLQRMIASALNLENYKCAEECSLVYICKDLQREEFYIFDGNISSEKLPSFMHEKLSFDSFAIGSVYFDVITLQELFPHRNYLYRKLKKSGVQIVSFLYGDILDVILNPMNYSTDEILLALDLLSAVLEYSSYIIFENKENAEKLDLICKDIKTKTWERSIFDKNTLLDILFKASKEQGSAWNINVTQMVVLTARNDDIMKSLPYIESFMPFIKKLVVCCPPKNVIPFKEKYKGRLKLSFITDDELLQGSSLPSDHQARNFFLRCRLMAQDSLDDVFIMTDDDYRPMKHIAEDVFISNGRYKGYYFYDIINWQGTYNDYTSFDIGAFKTRDFLIENNYPTLQYSSHQPQIIDKRIFKEMLMTHKGIENNPYDEWSTYFNYGFFHYPDKFMPCKSVSMCWPADLASWDIYHVPDEYLFENYYEELYASGQIFDGFSDIYNDNTESENIRKSKIYRKNALRQLKQRELFCEYQNEYSEKTGEYPVFVIYCDNSKIKLSAPEYIKMATDSWTRIPISIEKAVYNILGNNARLLISYHFVNNLGVPVLNSPEIPISTGDRRIMLPVRCPKSELKNAFFTVRINFAENENSSEHIFEKSIKLMLNKMDEVDYV